MKVVILTDSIEIFSNDTELKSWNQSEWEENPAVVFEIAQAIQIAYTKPHEMKKFLEKLS